MRFTKSRKKAELHENFTNFINTSKDSGLTGGVEKKYGRIEEYRCLRLLFRDARPSMQFWTFAKTGAGRGETRFAQTVSPSGANAKIRSRKMVSIPPKAAGDSGIFYPVFFLPSAPEPRKTTYMVKPIRLLISFYPLNRTLTAI